MEMLRRLPDDVAMDDIECHVAVMAGFEGGAREHGSGAIRHAARGSRAASRVRLKTGPTTTGWL